MVDLRKKLRSGMIAVTLEGRYLVLTDCETVNYGSQDFCLIKLDGFTVGSKYDENLSSAKSCYSINALYKPTVNTFTYKMEYEDKDLIWTRDPKNLKELIISRRFTE